MAKKSNKLSSMVAKPTTSKPVPVRIISDSPSTGKSDVDYEARERKWKAEDALRTCKEYAKITKDKQLMGDVKKLAKEEMKGLESVAKKY
jgi:hypothetical protein